MFKPITVLTRQGLTLCIDDQGGSGAPVVFQHGLCGDATQTREAFPNHSGYRRITLECRGHGRSEPGDPELFSIATFTDDLIALIESLGGRPVVVGGISMGAAISLRLAVTRPDLVESLILARPAWITASTPPNMDPNACVGALLNGFPADEAHKIFMRSETAKHLYNVAPDNLKSLEGFFQRKPQQVTADLLTRISADGPGVDQAALRTLSVPTLIIGHDHDLIHPYAHAEALAVLIPGSQLKTITAKSVSKKLYISGIHNAITQFLEELS
jgi:pimeloyl-ACP methyl ester carboxylesterase